MSKENFEIKDESPLPEISSSMDVLLRVSLGKISIIDAAHELSLPDGGFVLQLMRVAQLPLPKLPDELVRRQAEASREALKQCMIKS